MADPKAKRLDPLAQAAMEATDSAMTALLSRHLLFEGKIGKAANFLRISQEHAAKGRRILQRIINTAKRKVP